jgi:hypothetical protein
MTITSLLNCFGTGDLKEKHGITFSRRHLRRLEDTGKFPRRIHIGPKAPAWIESEVDGCRLAWRHYEVPRSRARAVAVQHA